ncbi:MAG: TrbC/VirB2 family protein [Alphaproteobacteria bacterium]|nr:TrbC/VirB2 family protein [Alphaproteobacteria bacterium]
MLCSKIKKFLFDNKYTLLLFFSLFLYTTDAFAAFEALNTAGKTIFKGLRKIIYPAATIGIASVCIGGMFGNFNWKWLIAILLGVFIIAYAEQTGSLATGDEISMSGDD